MGFDPVSLKELLGDKGYIRGPFGSALKRAELKKEGVPVYEQQHAITGTREFRFYIDQEKYNELKRFTVKTADLIISCSGTVGRVSIIENEDPKGIISQALLIMRPNIDKVIPQFLYYFLTSKQGFSELINASQGAVQLNIAPRAVVEKIPVPLPGLDKQREAVNILKALDDKIELNRRINRTLEEMAQAIFKSWFVDFEPVKAKIEAKANGQDPERAAMCTISGKTEQELAEFPADQYQQLATTAALFPDELVDSEQGLIPRGWRTLSLDRIAHYQNGLALQKFRPENENDFLPVVKIAQLKAGEANCAEKASPKINPACIIDNGDVVFSWSGSLIVDLWCGGKAALNQHLFKVTSEEYPKWFYYYWTKHHLAVFQQIAADKAVTMGHIKRSHLKEAKCVVPGFNIEKLSIINDLVNKQIAARMENISLAQLRDTLLPKLLSGEIDLSGNISSE